MSSKLRPGKLRPQTLDPKTHVRSTPPTPPPPRVARPSEGRKSRGKLLSHLLSLRSWKVTYSGKCAQRLMQAAEQIQIGQNSLTARNNTGARQESEPTQTASGPESLSSKRHQGLLSLLLKEVQETLKGLRIRLAQPRRSTGKFLVIGCCLGHRGVGRVVETAEGEEKDSQQHSCHISITRTRGQERSSVWLSASKMRFLPQAKESPLHKTA